MEIDADHFPNLERDFSIQNIFLTIRKARSILQCFSPFLLSRNDEDFELRELSWKDEHLFTDLSKMLDRDIPNLIRLFYTYQNITKDTFLCFYKKNTLQEIQRALFQMKELQIQRYNNAKSGVEYLTARCYLERHVPMSSEKWGILGFLTHFIVRLYNLFENIKLILVNLEKLYCKKLQRVSAARILFRQNVPRELAMKILQEHFVV